MTRPPACRWCHERAGALVRAQVIAAGLPGSALARRPVPVFEHAACLDAWTEAARIASELRLELYAASREAAQAGDLEAAVDLVDAATMILDTHYLPPRKV